MNERAEKPVILFLHPGPSKLHADPRLNMLHHLGQRLTGGAVFASWARDWEECASWTESTREASGGFDYRPVPSFHGRFPVLRPWRTVRLLYQEGLRCARSLPRPVQLVVGYSPYGVGLVTMLVARRLGVPYIIQVQNDMRRAYFGHRSSLTFVKRRLASLVARVVLERAAGWHVYFPGQTGRLRVKPWQRQFQFTDFTPVSAVPAGLPEEKTFLIVGYPWEVKGVDLAIRAFRGAGNALADWSLRVVGYCPDPAPYLRLANGDPRIRLDGPVPHVDALRSIATCGVYLMPSRTEAYGRVAIEAMAAGRPIIGTRVGGIPTYVRDGETGLIVEPESAEALRDAMMHLAHHPEVRQQLGQRARAIALSEHVEERWVDHFEHMVKAVVRS